MKVFVPGAGGLLGSGMLKVLPDSGEKEIRCLIRQERQGRDLIRLGDSYPGSTTEVFNGCITSRVDVDEAVNRSRR